MKMEKESNKELVIKPKDDTIVEGGYIKPPEKVTPPKTPSPAPPPKSTDPKKKDK
jgi:hypothetical protein